MTTSVGITLTDARLLLEAVLDAGGLPVMAHAGQLQAAPGVMVAAANPWVTPFPVAGQLLRLSRWRVLMVGGAVDLEGILDQLGTMVQLTLMALDAGPPAWIVERSQVVGPSRLPTDNATYLVAECVVAIPVDLSTVPDPSP